MNTRCPTSRHPDAATEIVLRAEALALQHFHNRGILTHVEGCRVFEGHAVAGRTLPIHCVKVSTVEVVTSPRKTTAG